VALALIGTGAAGSGGCSAEIDASSSVGGFGSVAVVSSSASEDAASSASSSNGNGNGGGGGGSGVGSACQDDAKCASGLTCLTSGASDPIFGGGAPDGFCTQACAADTDCLSPGSVCLKIDPGQAGRCTLSCTLGPAIQTVADLVSGNLDMDKCLGRDDLRCVKIKGSDGVCLPTCGSDSQCPGPGRACDPRLAVCVDKPHPGLSTGSACDPNESPTPCAGLCVSFDSGVAMCSTHCVLGGTNAFDCGGPEHGFCAFRPTANGAGDGGFCTPACAAHTDCQNPTFWCFNVPGLSSASNKGYCFAATPCPGGQSDCIAANDSNYLCTQTPAGSFCLDTAFAPIPAADAGP
jgi:hypothetical protein